MALYIKISILLENQCYLTAFSFPPSCICLSCCQVQFESNCVDRTKVRWTPIPLCIPLQSIQMKMPYVTLDQVGFLDRQSKHSWKNKCNQTSSTFLINLLVDRKLRNSYKYLSQKHINMTWPCNTEQVWEFSTNWL